MQPSFNATGYYDRPGHRYYPARGKGDAFGELELGDSYVRFHEAAEIDAVIAELVALRAEMTGGGGACRLTIKGEEVAAAPAPCPSVSPISGHKCALRAGHGGMHENGGICWSAGETPDGWCPASTELDDGETVYCDAGARHPGSHRAPGPDEGSEVAWSDCPSEMPYGGGVTCAMQAGHEGMHRTGATVWDGAPAQDESPATVTVKCLDKYEHIGNTDYCQRDKGHGGQHMGHMGCRWNQETARDEAPSSVTA